MDTADVLSAAVGVGGVLVALLAYFKRKPGQRERDDVDVAGGSLNVAQGTVTLVTETLQAQFIRMDREMDEMRREHAAYRLDVEQRLAELGAELRSEKAEKAQLVRENRRLKTQVAENDQLKQRITDLESEVQRLKARP